MESVTMKGLWWLLSLSKVSASVIALIFGHILEVFSVVAPECSPITVSSILALKAQPDFTPLFTDPSVKMITSPLLLFSSMRVSISAFAAPWHHSRLSPPIVAVTEVNLSGGSYIDIQSLPFLMY